MMDRVQNKPYSSIQHTPSSESFKGIVHVPEISIENWKVSTMAQNNRLCKHRSQNALILQAVDTFEGKELEWMMRMTTSPSLLPPSPFNNRKCSCRGFPATTGG
jgi:hypothetical protein